MRTVKTLLFTFFAFFVTLCADAGIPEIPDREVKINEEVFSDLNQYEQAYILDLQKRLNMAFEKDVSSMSVDEKASYKAEIRSLKKEMMKVNHSGHGHTLYVSTGGLIIIILLLIIIF